MPGYYTMMAKEPVPMGRMCPPAKSASMAKLNYPIVDHGSYEKNNKYHREERRNVPMVEKLRRQKSHEEKEYYPRTMYHSQPRRPEGFNSLQLLGSQDDERYLDRFMSASRTRSTPREPEYVQQPSKGKQSLVSTSGSNSNSKTNTLKKDKNKKSGFDINTTVALAFLGALKPSSSVDNIYESLQLLQFRKTMENMDRQEKVRYVQKSGHPLFDSLREEDAITRKSSNNTNSNTAQKRTSRSAGPSRKVSLQSSPIQSAASSGDEQENTVRRQQRYQSRKPQQPQPQQQQPQPQPQIVSWRRTGSAGSESGDEWVIPRPKIGGHRHTAHATSTDESDSSSKSSPIR